MSKLNSKSMVSDARVDKNVRLAGGAGKVAARQDSEALLRRCVMACLLWEDLAYQSGAGNAEDIKSLIPKVDGRTVADIAIAARREQKLRHVPLYIAREMARHAGHKKYVAEVLEKIITRADQLSDFLALYFKEGKIPLANCVKKGLAAAFHNFDEYQFAKYDRDAPIKLRDVMFMVHPKPKNAAQGELFRRIAERELITPETWEVELSAGKDKKTAFTDLIDKNKLGGLAVLRNLRNMIGANVAPAKIREAIKKLNTSFLLPLNFYSGQKHAPNYTDELEQAMFASFAKGKKLKGHTAFIIDVSGSMTARISDKSEFNRMEVAFANAMLAREVCEQVSIYLTGGITRRVPNHRGFALIKEMAKLEGGCGYDGIYTRRAVDFVKADLKDDPADRFIVFSDSQDCERHSNVLPSPNGKYNYIVDVSAHKHGVNYAGVWTAEISGWSDQFLTYIAEYEASLDSN